MATERKYAIYISSAGNIDEEEAFLRSVLDNGHILKWAYILHDKEYYNQHDFNVARLELRHVWIDGFPGMEKYSSAEEFIESKLKEYPQIGDRKESVWRILITVDETINSQDVKVLFEPVKGVVHCLTYNTDVLNELEMFLGEAKASQAAGHHQYSDDEIKCNFDLRAYMAEAGKHVTLEKMKATFDPAMLFGLCLFTFAIAAAIKFSTSKSDYPWLAPAIVGGIGVLYIVLNLLAMNKSKKEGRFISGIPFIGGVHLLVAGLMSPIRWLALLCLLDFTIWNFVAAIFQSKKK